MPEPPNPSWIPARKDGAARPLVLLHGFAGSRRDWWPFEDDIGEKPKRPLYVPDVAGHGLDRWTPPPRDAFPATAHQLVGELRSRVAGPAVWAGYSFGARLACAIAVEEPDAVSALILESVSPGIAESKEREARRAQDEADAALLETKGLRAFLNVWHGREIFATRRGRPGWDSEVQRKEATNRPEALARVLRSLGTGTQPDFRPRLRGIKVPALLITGERDERYTRLSQEIQPLFVDARHAVVPGVGHAPHIEAPDRFLQIVNGFLASLPE